MNLKGFFSAIIAASFFGLIPTFAKISYNLGANPELAIILRYLLATIIIAIPLIFLKIEIKLIKQNIFLLILISFGSIILTSGLLISVIYIPVSLMALIFYTYPLFVMGFAHFFRNKLTKIQITIFFVAFIGLSIALGPNFKNLNLIGIIFAFLASLGAATILLTNELLSKKFDAIFINAFVNITCLIVLGIIIILKLNVSYPSTMMGWSYILCASLFYTMAFLAQLIAVKNIGSTKTSLLLYLEPLVAIISAIIFLNEVLSLSQIIGTIIVFFSLFLSSKTMKI